MCDSYIFDFDGVIDPSFCFHHEMLNKFLGDGEKIAKTDLQDAFKGNLFESKLKELDWKGYFDYIRVEQAKREINDRVKKTLLEISKKSELYIVSSSDGGIISNFLENNGLGEKFTSILGAESGLSKVDKLNSIVNNKARSGFITDTLGDILEGKQVPDLKIIAITGGFHDKSTLQEGNPDLILDDFAKIPDAFSQIFS